MPCWLVNQSDIQGDTFFHWYDSPLGQLLLTGNDIALFTITFPNQKNTPKGTWHKSARPFSKVCKQLDNYFKGQLRNFELPLAPKGTDFQSQVWRALLEIPYGQTTSYSAIAESIGRPKAVRAVGGANGRNPIPIIVPCHRVIGRDGSLTGFGGGLPVKTFLLNLENSEQLALEF